MYRAGDRVCRYRDGACGTITRGTEHDSIPRLKPRTVFMVRWDDLPPDGRGDDIIAFAEEIYRQYIIWEEP